MIKLLMLLLLSLELHQFSQITLHIPELFHSSITLLLILDSLPTDFILVQIEGKGIKDFL